MSIGVDVGDWDFELELGPVPHVPTFPPSLFNLDPDVKREILSVVIGKRRVVLAERKGPTAFVRDANGDRATYPLKLWSGESILAQLAEPSRFPVLSAVQASFRHWRFYHHFRSDPEAPARTPQVGIRTPVLSHDARDLAAALQTIIENGDDRGLHEAIDRAFPGARVHVLEERGRFTFDLEQPGLMRPLSAREVSDGTLRYLCLVAALLSPRPPLFLALNEPETSLHPDLLEPLGWLISEASDRSQVFVTTHARALARSLADHGAEVVELGREDGATVVSG